MSKRDTHWKAISLKGERRLTAGLVHHRWPAWSPDGDWVAFAAGDGADAAWVVADRRGRVARVLAGPAQPGASFAPGDHGHALAFARSSGAASEIWLLPGPGAQPLRLLGGDGQSYRQPAYSPDGKTLALVASDGPDARAQIWLLDVASGARTKLSRDPDRADTRPVFAPRGGEGGDLVFFEGTRGDGDSAVYAYDLGRNEEWRVTPSDSVNRCPAPLSRELLIVEREREGKQSGQLWLIDWRRARERLLEDVAGDRREPSTHAVAGGKTRLAWIEPSDDADEPRRFDVHVARVRGVPSAAPRPEVIEVTPAENPSTDT